MTLAPAIGRSRSSPRRSARIVLGGMAAGGTSAHLVSAVSSAGGLGTLGLSTTPVAGIGPEIAAIRAATAKPLGVNHLLFFTEEANFVASLDARP